MERNYTKEQILAGYLNLVYYGDQAYGVEAAAQNYFGVPAAKATLGQSALLAGIVQQPTKYNPVINPKQSQSRRNAVLDRMQALGLATPVNVAAAKKQPVAKMLGNRKPPKGVCQRSSQPFFCAYMMEYLQKSPQMAVLGKTPAERLKNINQGGLTINTTLDTKPAGRDDARASPTPSRSATRATSVQPRPSSSRAPARSSPWPRPPTSVTARLNLNVDQRYGGSQYGYQFGSTAKMYALVTALESGMPLDATVTAPVASPEDSHVFTNKDMHDKCRTAKEGWPVKNDYKSGGTLTLAKMTAESINTSFAQAHHRPRRLQGARDDEPDGSAPGRRQADRHGDPRRRARRRRRHPDDDRLVVRHPRRARQVLRAHPDRLDHDVQRQGHQGPADAVQAGHPGRRRRRCQPGSSRARSTTAAAPPRARGRSRTARPPARRERPTTTTSRGSSATPRSAPPRSGSATSSRPRPTASLLTLNRKTFGKYGYKRSVFGGTVAGPVWGKIMKAATDGLPIVPFTPPSSAVLNGNYVPLPDVVGDSVETATEKLEGAGFRVRVGSRVDSTVREGRVAMTAPKARAPKGGQVTLLISRGYQQPVFRYDPQPQPRQTVVTPPPTRPTAGPGPKVKPTKPPKRP